MLNPDQTRAPPKHTAEVHTSAVLRSLIEEAPPTEFTLRWLIGNLPHRSFGAIMLLLAIIAMVPVISIVAGLLIAALAVQIILGYRTPRFPSRLMNHPLPSRYLRALEQHAIPLLDKIETVVRPRWPVLVQGTLRVVGIVVLLLTVILLTFPLPLSNIPPAAVITATIPTTSFVMMNLQICHASSNCIAICGDSDVLPTRFEGSGRKSCSAPKTQDRARKIWRVRPTRRPRVTWGDDGWNLLHPALSNVDEGAPIALPVRDVRESRRHSD